MSTINKVIEINVEAQGAINAMEGLEGATKTAGKSFDTATNFAGRYGKEMEPLTTKISEAEDRLYELAKAGHTNTQEYRELIKVVVDYKRIIKQTDTKVDAMAGTMSQKMSGALMGVSSGFSVATGLMGTFGSESEEMQKLLLRVNSAMAMTQGLQGLKESSPLFKTLKTSAGNALKGIKTGIAATGVGVLLIAVGAIVAYWDDIKEVVSGVGAEQKKLNALSKEQLDLESEKLKALSLEENALRLQGKSEDYILQRKIDQTKKVIEKAKAELETSIQTTKMEHQAAKANQERTKTVLAMMQLPLMILLKAVDSLTYGFEKLGLMDKGTSFANDLLDWESSFFFDADATKAEGEKVIKERKDAIAKLESDQAGHELRMKSLKQPKGSVGSTRSTGSNTKSSSGPTEEDEAEKLRLEKERDFQDKIDKIAEQNHQNKLKNLMTEKAYELEVINQKYLEMETTAKGNAKQLATIAIAKGTEVAEIEAKHEALRIEAEEAKQALRDEVSIDAQTKELNALTEKSQARLLIADGDKELMLLIAAEEAEGRLKIDEKYAKQKKDIEQKLMNQKVGSVKAGFQLASNLAELFAGKSERQQKKLFEFQKKANMAIALIDTYRGAQSAYATTVGGPIVKGVAAGIAVTAGLLNVKKIANTTFQAPSPDSTKPPSELSGGNITTPNFNVVGDAGINQTDNLQPQKVFVVSTDVTSQQELDRSIIATSVV